MRAEILHADSREALAAMKDASIDACVTDPPYALVSIGKRFGADDAAPAKAGASGVYARASAGFMGQKWDTGEVAFDPAFWREVLRVLKPGGHLLAFGGTRTYHRLVCAIEDGGFEIRDAIQWLYGSGFPKSHDVSKGIDKAAGAERELTRPGAVQRNGYGGDWDTGSSESRPRYDTPATEAARQWDGWGTALKPACEIICVARKPLIGTVAANVLQHGTGALNIDACRVATSAEDQAYIAERIGGFNNTRSIGGDGILGGGQTMDRAANYDASKGRWPANVVLSWPEDHYALRNDLTKEQKSAVYGWLNENA